MVEEDVEVNCHFLKKKMKRENFDLFERTLNKYSKWNQEHDKGTLLDIEKANNFIRSIKNSSAPKIKYHLQKILSHFMGDIKLDRISLTGLSVKPKAVIEREVLVNYLTEQAKSNYHDYLFQLFLATFGVRINTPINLKYEHLQEIEDNILSLPDKKVNVIYKSKISEAFKTLLLSAIENMKERDKNEYVFYPEFKDENKRMMTLKKRTNRKIKKNLKEKFPKEMVVSSHIFRKTKCSTIYNEGLKKLLDESGSSIGHAPCSQATLAYISSQRWLPENKEVPLIDKNGKRLVTDTAFDNILPSPMEYKCYACGELVSIKNYCFCLNIREIKKEEIEKLNEFYKVYFPEAIDLVSEITINSTNLGYYEDGELCGAISYKKVKYSDNISFLLIKLLSVDFNKRGRRIGTKLLQALQNIWTKILVWADEESVKFYKKNLFTEAKSLCWSLVNYVGRWNESIFMKWGFKKEELNEMLNK